MCRTDFDETWEVWDSWWGAGRCCDCGNVGRVLFEELGPERDEEYDEDMLRLILNDGVPDLGASTDEIWDRGACNWRDDWDPFAADPSEVVGALPPRVNDTEAVCERCLEVRRWLKEWCRTWVYGDCRSDVIEHWLDHEIARHHAFGRLVVLARRNWRATHRTVGSWRDQQPLVPVDVVAGLVDESLAWLRAETGRRHAA